MRRAVRLKPQLSAALIGGAVLAAMVALSLAAQGTDPARYNAPEEILRQMSALDAGVNQDAFELRFGLQNSYDALNDKLTAMALLRDRLLSDLKVVGVETSPEMRTARGTLDKTFADKQEQAEQFKTANAVLSNSRYYFPSICEFVRTHYGQNAAYPHLNADLLALEHDVLLHNLSGHSASSAAALTRIPRIRGNMMLLPERAQRDLNSLLLHAAMLVRSNQRVNSHLTHLIAVPSSTAYDRVSAALERNRFAEFRATTVYRAVLSLVGLGVFTYAVAAFLKTRRQAKELHAANETLEHRVCERTHDLQMANAELQQSEERFRAIFANASIGIGQLSLNGKLLQANAALCATLNGDPTAWSETALSDCMDSEFRTLFEDKLSTLHHSWNEDGCPAEQSAAMEIRFVHSDGSERWGQVRVSLVRAENTEPLFFILLIQDTTAQKAAEEHIERLAYHDALTGLPNRPAFLARLHDVLERAEAKQQTTALFFIDCDNFKQINDTLGHEAGDEFLKQRAACMRDSLRPGDTLARLGGDEFTILLENLPDDEMALHVARRVLRNLGQPMNLMGYEIFGGASIGIAFNRGDDVTAESMLRNADTAMYQVKTSGKGNCAIFEQEMNDRINEQMRLENGLRRALEQGELRVHYQPLIDLATGRLTGTEALVRWEHPDYGLIPPGKFIPIAEDTGLIVPLGYWVLEEACRQTKQWQTELPQYPPLMVNVNLSGHQLKRADIVERILEIVAKTELPMQCLKLEITESVMMENLEDARNKLHQLKLHGIKIALDDFGTGYSSMASLVDLPVDSIKIDRSFVSRMGDQEQAGAAVSAIIAIAKAHGLDVTGEGVETQDQVELLQNYGCLLGQGYFFAKPLSADAMNARVLEMKTLSAEQSFSQSGSSVIKLREQLASQAAQQLKPAA
jgi:diguanylate cyclase (GGDEF)-like protein/PAS domain S-box-containing protein